MTFPIDRVRAAFSSLEGGAVRFDGPAGSQVPDVVIEAMASYLRRDNANTHGDFAASVRSDALLDRARAAMADFIGADDPDCVIFGPNMTSLTFAISRAMAATWRPTDEIVVTRLDHDANVTPWVRAAADAGASVHFVGFTEDGLDYDELDAILSERTRLVACTAASNCLGLRIDVRRVADAVHRVGAELYVDAVHYAPHGLIDVVAWDCDYLACSPYKFFGPHAGVLWGRRERMASLPVYRVRPAGDALPGRWETGTQSHESIAGTLAAVEYLAGLGEGQGRRARLVDAFARIEAWETLLGARLEAGLAELPVRLWGTGDRVPTYAITHQRVRPPELSRQLAEADICVWHGDFYAVGAIEALGLQPDGVVRIGLLHYNTPEEVDRLLDVLRSV